MIKRIYNGIAFRFTSIHTRINAKIKKSNWYHGIFPHLCEYERLRQGADIICIGSTPAKNAIDFRNIKSIRGYNLAVCPETIFYDFQVLKNYHSYLRKGGTVIFVLCPFTFLKDYYRNEYGSKSYLNIRYYPILHRAMIDTFDYKLYRKWVEEPVLIGKNAWKRLLKDTASNNTLNIRSNPDTVEQSKSFCEERVNGWMREFHLKDLNPNNIPVEIEDAIKGNLDIYRNMKSFVEERGYKAYIIVPPFPEEMTSLLPKEFVEHTLFEPIRKTGLPYLSYFWNEEWLSRDFYYHGFLLNAMGRELLTKDIIKRLNSNNEIF